MAEDKKCCGGSCGCDHTQDEHHDHDIDMEESIVVMTDEEGNERYYREEVLFPVGDDTFAVLVELNLDGEDGEESPEKDPDVFMAKVITDETGEETYTDPTEEEFQAALVAYEEFFESEDEDEAE